MVKDFRPISFIGCIYKIIAKILTNRLVGVIGDIVNEVQSAFIAYRQIIDGPFILNEVMHWCTVKKKQALIFMVDIEKAYDSVRWDFLDEFGFGNKWRMWIQSSLRSLRGSILVNGSPTEEFQFYKGHWNDSNINTLVNVLECFYRASGLRINMCKSKIMGVHVEGGKMYRVKEWNEVVDKVVSRLSKWKMKTLSIGGRLTLLKSVLGSIPIFHMSIYRVPSRVLQQLESNRNSFFNGNDLGSKKATWIKWSNVLADKAKGGLGVSSLYALNREVSVLQAKGVNVMNYVRLKLGNGESTSFWEDNWINSGVLKDVFPRLYALEICKKVYVSLNLKDSSLETSFRRKVRGAEQAQLDILSDMVREVGLVPMSDRQIARKVFSWWNVDYVDANSYEEWLDWLGSLRLPAKLKLMLEGVFYVVWCLVAVLED
nr:hypothetical protein [Tanacetum cinerariifolium]